MSKNNNHKQMIFSDKKERYKTYKSNKTWIYATITGVASIFGGSGIAVPIVRADSAGTTDTNANEVNSDKLLVNQDKTTIPATNRSSVEKISTNQEASISISDQAYNPVNGWYTEVSGYWTYGIAALNNDNNHVLILLISKQDPNKLYFTTGTYNGSAVIADSGKVPTQVTSADQNIWGGAKVRLNGSSGVYVTRPSNGQLYVKYRSASGGTIGPGNLGPNVNWTPLLPSSANVTVKYQDEAGNELRPDTNEGFYSQIQGYSINNIPQFINGLDYISHVGNLTGRTTSVVVLKYSAIPSQSNSDSVSDSVSDSDSISDSSSSSELMSDSISDSSSDSVSGSDSLSDSNSISDSTSELSSQSDFSSNSDSTSDSLSGSDSLSNSLSDSLSNSGSLSDSDSTSDSMSSSDSTSDSISDSNSLSDSDSTSDSISDSESASDSISDSDSLSDSDSISDSISDSESASDSISDSDSLSDSDSISDSISDSESASDSISDSDSLSDSDSTSDSVSDSDSLSDSDSTSDSVSNSDSLSDSDSTSDSVSDSDSLSDSDST
ncbi:KxYKxGKxW signal peptide domain-containing protein, partial [Leuconostoc citreum]